MQHAILLRLQRTASALNDRPRFLAKFLYPPSNGRLQSITKAQKASEAPSTRSHVKKGHVKKAKQSLASRGSPHSQRSKHGQGGESPKKSYERNHEEPSPIRTVREHVSQDQSEDGDYQEGISSALETPASRHRDHLPAEPRYGKRSNEEPGNRHGTPAEPRHRKQSAAEPRHGSMPVRRHRDGSPAQPIKASQSAAGPRDSSRSRYQEAKPYRSAGRPSAGVRPIVDRAMTGRPPKHRPPPVIGLDQASSEVLRVREPEQIALETASAGVIDKDILQIPDRTEGGAEHSNWKGKRPEPAALLELECTDLNSEGEGICKTETGFVLFVRGAVPGEKLKVKVTNVKAGYAQGERIAVLEQSPQLVTAQCRHYQQCGGCNQQHLYYNIQLELKNRRISETLKRIGKFEEAENLLLDPVPCQETYRYRNKMTFSLNTDTEWLKTNERKALEVQPTIGLYGGGKELEIVEIDDCLLQDETANRILAITKRELPKIQAKALVVFTKIIIRKGTSFQKKTPEYMVILYSTTAPTAIPIPREEQALDFHEYVEVLVSEIPQVVSIFDCRGVIGKDNQYPVLNRLFGTSILDHVVGGIPFAVSPLSFFQVNTQQAGVLVDMVIKAAGLFGISLAKHMMDTSKPLRNLNGYEAYNQAIANARTNATRIGLDKSRFTFKSADLSQPTLGARINCDIVIVDPARAGLPDPVIDFLFRCKARTLIYVSCDIATQARDLHALCHTKDDRRWTLESVQLCDMFPHTSHAESVAVLRREVTWEVGLQKNAYVKMPAQKRKGYMYDKSGLQNG